MDAGQPLNRERQLYGRLDQRGERLEDALVLKLHGRDLDDLLRLGARRGHLEVDGDEDLAPHRARARQAIAIAGRRGSQSHQRLEAFGKTTPSSLVMFGKGVLMFSRSPYLRS